MDPVTSVAAQDAGRTLATSHGLTVDAVDVLQDANRLVARLRPADVVVRVAIASSHGRAVAARELAVARALVAVDAPVGAPHPDVEPVVHEHDGFLVTAWQHLGPVTDDLHPMAHATALRGLHRSMRRIDAADVPSCATRIDEALAIVDDPARSPSLTDDDRRLLRQELDNGRAAIAGGSDGHQVLHGEPHRRNMVVTAEGARFVDFQTICRGPVEFDLAHLPADIAQEYPGIDRALLARCRRLVIAMVAAWRADATDHYPDGARILDEFLTDLRSGGPLRHV